MRLKFVSGTVLVAALAAVLLLPGSALPVADVHEHDHGLADYDSRTGKVAPTNLQRSLAAKMKAKVSWGQFGTPASITRYGKFLSRNVRGKTAAAAARLWLKRNYRVFGLRSLDGVALESANRLASSHVYAVNFRQVFKGLPASDGGLVTIGVRRAKNARAWHVGYVSSSLTRDSALVGSLQLSQAEGWARAAKSAKLARSIANILTRKRVGRWTQLGVAGLDTPQRVRTVAFPTVGDGVVPAYESIVQDTKRAKGYRAIVDARNGRVLLRHTIVHNVAAGFRHAAVTVTPFNGTLPAVDGGCGPNHPITVPAGIRAFSGFANATNPLTDITLDLFRVGPPDVQILHADTVFTPERFRYEPAGGVPPGDYYVRVCEFANNDGPPPEPRTYDGTLTLDDTPAPPAYWARWATTPSSFPLNLEQDPWHRPATDTRETWCWRSAPGCDRVIGNLASRAPWDHNMKTDQPTFTTVGNNALTAESWTNENVPAPFQFRPTSPTRDYVFPWTDSWNQSDCNASLGFTPGVSWDVSASVVALFVAHNRVHDWAYHLGLTEENWNAQDHNFGRTEQWRQNDAVLGDAQSGAAIPTQQAFALGARNNANMSTVPEGGSSVTNMYFWQPQAGSFYGPCADGDFDTGVIVHEYGHLIENRLIGKGGLRAPFPFHTSPMGEGHADLFAIEYLNAYNFFPGNGENKFAVGWYDTGNKQRAIRSYGMNFPMSGGVPEPGQQLTINSLNFSDLGYDVTGPQQHADGEVYSATHYTLRQLLVDKYDDDFPAGDRSLQEDCADGLMPVYRCPGNRRWIQLVFDAMILMPPNASMIQARDALLAADMLRFGGANQKELWLGYARRGFGRNAAGGNLLTNSDLDPVPDFEPVGTESATVRFRAENRDGNPVNARIYVGHYEARVSPIADTNPATPAAGTPASAVNFDNTAKFAPGTYEFVAHAPGYGHVRFRERFRSGENERIDIEFPTNWASSSSGASASTTDGGTAGSLIDDTEATNWAATATNTGGTLSVDGKKATVDLGGSDPVRVRYVQVSAHIGPGAGRFAALRQFELWACNGASADCSTDVGYRRVYTSAANAFPGDPPRPVAPHLILRRFDVPDFMATHVRFVVRSTQCTGGLAFQGDQDADPANNPDCDTNVPANSTRNFARTAELQVFSRSAEVDD